MTIGSTRRTRGHSRTSRRATGSTTLTCPECDGPTVVDQTRPTAGGAVTWRRRICVDCALRFSTYETIAPGPYPVAAGAST